MVRRLTVTVLAGALVLGPSMRAGLDAARLIDRPAAAAEARSSAGLATLAWTSGGARLNPARAAPSTDDALEAAGKVPSFGFGAKTAFFPTDSPRELVLSFDDGPDLKFTPLVLDELDRRGLKAIFFVTGERVVGDSPEGLARRDLLRKIAAHGHLVANHTLSHRNLCRDPDEAAAEIDGNAEMIAEATGIRPLLFRAPYGARCKSLEDQLATRQLRSVGWNLDPQDWRNPESDEILRYLEAKLSRLEGRGILLIHDTHPASVYALAPLFDWIARENRRAVDEGRAPIVLRDYSVFLPARPVPQTGIQSVAAALSTEMRLPLLLGRLL